MDSIVVAAVVVVAAAVFLCVFIRLNIIALFIVLHFHSPLRVNLQRGSFGGAILCLHF